MRSFSLLVLVAMLSTLLAGCLVRTNGHHHHGNNSSARRGGSCGPAYHWNGYRCVHNGRGHAKGHRR